MFKRMQEHPDEGPRTCREEDCSLIEARLPEFMAVHAIITRASIEEAAVSNGWQPKVKTLQ
jgi:hypothetical protein